MGRLLEIVRDMKWLPTLSGRTVVPGPAAPPRSVPVPPKPCQAAETPFDAPASAVLQIIVQAQQPLSHPEIVRRMLRRGHDKTAACQAIARCQKRRWIEHNLETGYILS